MTLVAESLEWMMTTLAPIISHYSQPRIQCMYMSTSAHRSRGGALGGLGVVSMVPRVIDSMCTEVLKPGIAVSSWAVGTTAASAVLTLLGLSVLVTVTRIGYGMLRAYYILRVRAGLPVVLWLPKFWRVDGRRQTGSSLSRVLERMETLNGPHDMYGTVFGTQAVVHVADPEAAAAVLSQHTKQPGYNHFSGFFGRGVFTADGEEWRAKRASVVHAVFRGKTSARAGAGTGPRDDVVAGRRDLVGNGSPNVSGGFGNGSKDLTALANEEADLILREVEEALRLEGGDGDEVKIEAVRLLQRHTLNLVHRFLCGGDDVSSSPRRKRLLNRYLDAVTDMRIVILARSRSVWMFAWSWAYRAFSRLHRRELRNMEPIRDFAELVLETAISEGDTSGECGAMRNGLENGSLVFRRGEVNRNGTVDEERRCVPTTIVKKNEEEGGIGDKMEDGSFEAKRGELETGNTERNPGGNGRMEDYCLKARCGEWENDSALEDDRRGLLENATTTESEHPGNGGSERVIGDQVVQERVGNGVGVASGNGTVARKEWSSGVGRRRRTALSNMAERESHRKYPNAMLDETITLLFAGQDTSAATLSWTLHLLSLPENKDYVLQIRREAQAAAAHHPQGHVDVSTVGKHGLPMVDACIKEAQRLYPVAPFVVRYLSSDLKLKDGTLLPAGALACVWIYGLHHHPRLWDSPEAFLPRRWLAGGRQAPGAFIPYASGPRGCVGRPFARIALRVLLARLCLALDFCSAETTPDSGGVEDRCSEWKLPTEPSITASSDAGAESNTRPLPACREEYSRERSSCNRPSCGEDSSSCNGFSCSGGHELVCGVKGEKYEPPRWSRSCKEMQAGFTVLPAGGVHLRVKKCAAAGDQ